MTARTFVPIGRVGRWRHLLASSRVGHKLYSILLWIFTIKDCLRTQTRFASDVLHRVSSKRPSSVGDGEKRGVGEGMKENSIVLQEGSLICLPGKSIDFFYQKAHKINSR